MARLLQIFPQLLKFGYEQDLREAARRLADRDGSRATSTVKQGSSTGPLLPPLGRKTAAKLAR